MRRIPFLALLLCGCGAQTPEAPAAKPPSDQDRLEALLQAPDSDLSPCEKALPGLEAGEPRDKRLARKIRAALIRRDREADAAFVSGSPQIAALPEGAWAVVAKGQLAGSGASREEALAKAGSPGGLWHRYVWKQGEPARDATVERGSLSPGDVGEPLRALGRPLRIRRPSSGDAEALLSGGAPEDFPELAVVLGDPEALRLGLNLHEIPGRLTVRSRMGAGVLCEAWRASALALGPSGEEREVLAWVVPEPGLRMR